MMMAPLLVVEVVSPSTIAVDYRAKHSEYAVLDIAEYWIVDPLAKPLCQETRSQSHSLRAQGWRL
jgi:Uma2 family endonuclease